MKKVLSIILVLALVASAVCAVVFNGQKNDLQAQLSQEASSGLFDDCFVGVFDGR